MAHTRFLLLLLLIGAAAPLGCAAMEEDGADEGCLAVLENEFNATSSALAWLLDAIQDQLSAPGNDTADDVVIAIDPITAFKTFAVLNALQNGTSTADVWEQVRDIGAVETDDAEFSVSVLPFAVVAGVAIPFMPGPSLAVSALAVVAAGKTIADLVGGA